MAITRNPVRPHVRRAIRTALGVGIACSIGYGIFLPLEGPGIVPYARNVANASKWAAITCVVVTVPVLGKVTQVGFERTLGTVMGGTLGFVVNLLGSHIWTDASDGYFLSVASALFAYACCMASYRLKLDVSMKLTMITFLLVTFGAGDDGPGAAFETAVTRTAGIATGVVLSLLLSVIIFPKSASMEAVWELRGALDALVKLGDICWKTQSIFKQELLHSITSLPPGAALAAAAASGYAPLPAGDPEVGTPEREAVQALYCKEAEDRLNDLYNKLAKAADMGEQSTNEILVGVFRGRWPSYPGFPACAALPGQISGRTWGRPPPT